MADYLVQTDRVGLRTWTMTDLEPLSLLNADKRVMEYFPNARTSQESKAFIESQQRAQAAEGYCFFAADELKTGSFIGFIGILKFKFEAYFSPGVEIGWRLAFDHWGKGYATEGAKGALDFAFDQKSIPEIWSFTTVTNQRSENVMKKIGMTKVGAFEHPKIEEGHPLRPHVLYHISKP